MSTERRGLWWQREPPDGWRYERNVERAVVMVQEYDASKCDLVLAGWGSVRAGWCIVHSDEGSIFTLTGGGADRPRNPRRQSIANNDDRYTMALQRG